METLSQFHDVIHLKILPTLLEVFLRHLSYCLRKIFYQGYDKIDKFSNIKCNLVFRFNKLQDTPTELDSKKNLSEDLELPLNYN